MLETSCYYNISMTYTTKKSQQMNFYNNGFVKNVESHSSIAIKLIVQFQEVISLGYSEENWTKATRILREFARYTEKTHVDSLGNLMTEMYTAPSFARIQEVCSQVSSNLMKHSYNR